PTPTPTPTPTPAELNGKTRYAQSCAGCHGSNPALNQNKILNGANAPSVILNAITKNMGGMGGLASIINAQEAADLAAYLANPGI
ncbi:MAG: c-type cytochrome, partial [Rhodoferax sp.]